MDICMELCLPAGSGPPNRGDLWYNTFHREREQIRCRNLRTVLMVTFLEKKYSAGPPCTEIG